VVEEREVAPASASMHEPDQVAAQMLGP